MKFKYYLRGLGIGIIITTIVLMIAYSGYKTELTDEEIIARAESLGMVMEEDPLFSNSETNSNTEVVAETEVTETTEQLTEHETETDVNTETQSTPEIEGSSENENEAETESESEVETESESEVVTTGETYYLVIPSGSVPRLICNELEENGVIESASALRQYLVEVGYATSIKVGEYNIPYGATNEEVYQILKAGPL